MSASAPELIVYPTEQLLPEAWRSLVVSGPVRAFNPGLVRDGDGWLFAYRIAGAGEWRKIGLCRLDQALRVVAGSQMPLSDWVRFPGSHSYPEIVTRWFADPRLYRLQERLFIYWNSGWHEPQNHQFLQELDPKTLRPIGSPRELVLRGARQKLEKNWTLFEDGAGNLRAIYSILPHRVLALSLAGESAIVCAECAQTAWQLENYPASHGGLRGGAPPWHADGRFWSFCHSVHDAADGYRYAPAVYCFEPFPPYAPTHQPSAHLDIGYGGGSRRDYPRLNAAVGEVLYPCGALRAGGEWLLSVGINDERCAIARLDAGAVKSTLRPVPSGAH